MAFNEALASRVRAHVEGRKGFTEKKMFGGLAFLLNGNMACGILGDEIVLRVKGLDEGELLRQPGCRPFDFTGRPMRGFVLVAGSACADPDALADWLDPSLRAAAALPPKARAAAKPRAARKGRAAERK